MTKEPQLKFLATLEADLYAISFAWGQYAAAGKHVVLIVKRIDETDIYLAQICEIVRDSPAPTLVAEEAPVRCN